MGLILIFSFLIISLGIQPIIFDLNEDVCYDYDFNEYYVMNCYVGDLTATGFKRLEFTLTIYSLLYLKDLA